MEDCYIKEFDASVININGKYVFLDKTAFYPNSGGQPHDTGILVHNGEEFKVIYTAKLNGNISHEVDKVGLKIGDKVIGKIDWNRRYLFMRYHTASHVLSGLINRETGAKITGNQISEDKTRIDFDLENFDREKIKEWENEANKIIEQGRNVILKILPREEAFKIPAIVKLRMAFPENIKNIRIVEIEDFDQQACAGTHVKNTKEIGKIEIIKTENKGKNNRRIYFVLK